MTGGGAQKSKEDRYCFRTHQELDRPFSVDLPADVQRPAPVGGDGEAAAPVRLQLPDRRRVCWVLENLVHGGKPEVIVRPPKNRVTGQLLLNIHYHGSYRGCALRTP